METAINPKKRARVDGDDGTTSDDDISGTDVSLKRKASLVYPQQQQQQQQQQQHHAPLTVKDIAYKVDGASGQRCLARILFPFPSQVAECIKPIGSAIRELDSESVNSAVILMSCYRDETDLAGGKGHVTLRGVRSDPLIYQTTIPVRYVDENWPTRNMRPLVVAFDAAVFLARFLLCAESKLSIESKYFNLTLGESTAIFSMPTVSEMMIGDTTADSATRITATHFVSYAELPLDFGSFPTGDKQQHNYDYNLDPIDEPEHFPTPLGPQFISCALASAGRGKSGGGSGGGSKKKDSGGSVEERAMSIRISHAIETHPLVQCRQDTVFQFFLDGSLVPCTIRESSYIKPGCQRWSMIKECIEYDDTTAGMSTKTATAAPAAVVLSKLSVRVDRNRMLGMLGAFSKETVVTLCMTETEMGWMPYLKAERACHDGKRTDRTDTGVSVTMTPAVTFTRDDKRGGGGGGCDDSLDEKWSMLIFTPSLIASDEAGDVRTLTDADAEYYSGLAELIPRDCGLDLNSNVFVLPNLSWAPPL